MHHYSIATDFMRKGMSFVGFPDMDNSIIDAFCKKNLDHPWFSKGVFVSTTEFVRENGGVEKICREVGNVSNSGGLWTLLKHFSESGVDIESFLHIMVQFDELFHTVNLMYCMDARPQFCGPRALKYLLSLMKN